MLKNLPIIPSRTSQNFYLLFLFYSQVPLNIPFYSIVLMVLSQYRIGYIQFI